MQPKRSKTLARRRSGWRSSPASLSTSLSVSVMIVLETASGEVTEWFKVTVLKTVVGQLTASSNLALSATLKYDRLGHILVCMIRDTHLEAAQIDLQYL